MTETTEREPSEVTKVARNLSAIEDLCASLEVQVIHKANDRELPGGNAMVALAGVANLEAYENQIEFAETVNLNPDTLRTVDLSHLEEEDDTWVPPLQTLRFWSEAWRREHNADYDMRITIATEVNFIRHLLPWAWENEVHFEDFAQDIKLVRVRLENMLYAGRRAERSRVSCDKEGCEKKPRLIKIYGDDPTGDLDEWRCPGCKTRYDAKAFKATRARHLRSEGAEKFVNITDAIGMLRGLGRAESTIRKWFAECKVDAYCDPVTREQLCWWPDLWTLHLTTKTRQRMSA